MVQGLSLWACHGAPPPKSAPKVLSGMGTGPGLSKDRLPASNGNLEQEFVELSTALETRVYRIGDRFLFEPPVDPATTAASALLRPGGVGSP